MIPDIADAIDTALFQGLLDVENAASITDAGAGDGTIASIQDTITTQLYSQATALARPVYSTTSWNGLRPGLTFTAANGTYLRNTNAQAWPLSGAFEVWMLVYFAADAPAATQTLLHWPVPSTGAGLSITRKSDGVVRLIVGDGAGTDVHVDSKKAVARGMHILRFVVTGTEIYLFADGDMSLTDTVVPALSGGPRNTVGADASNVAVQSADMILSYIAVTDLLTEEQAAALEVASNARRVVSNGVAAPNTLTRAVEWLEFDARLTPYAPTSPAAIITADGADFFESIDPVTGHFLDNDGNSRLVTIGVKGDLINPYLELESNKQASFVVRAGLVMDSALYVDRGLLAIEAVLSYRSYSFGGLYTGPAGSTPGQKQNAQTKAARMQNKLIVYEKIAPCMMMLLNSTFYTGARGAYIDGLITQLEEVANWMSSDDAVEEFFDKGPGGDYRNTNQLVSYCSFMQCCGVLYDSSDMREQGRARLAEIFQKHMSTDGVLHEDVSSDGIGFDGVYQSVSKELLTNYHTALETGEWADIVLDRLRKAAKRSLRMIDRYTGYVDDTGWSRTGMTEQVQGYGPIDFDRDSYALRWHIMRDKLGDTVPPDLPDLILGAGQSFGHLDDA